MPRTRYQPPERLLGATDYSKHDELRGSLNTVKLATGEAAWASDGLRDACVLEARHGRKREPGRWELAMVAFVASRQVDLQPWWDESTDELWRECGFNGKPPYSRVWERLRELGEERNGAFLDATALVIQRCKEHDPRVFAHAHVDSTEDETHAALAHDCQSGEPCARAKEDDGDGAHGESANDSVVRIARAATGEARRQREAWNEEDPQDAEEHASEATPETDEPASQGKGRRLQLSNGCWYRTLDPEAGVRMYGRNGAVLRFWHGYFSSKMVCHLTGGVIPLVESASTQEYDLFKPLYNRVVSMAGAAPQTVIGDKGFSVEKVFEHATRHGTAPVFPWRASRARKEPYDKESHDRDGVMRCRHCGGETKQTRFAIEKGKNTDTPYLWFKCVAPATPDCGGEQRVRCETDWRSLVPLSRLEPLYQELSASHWAYEGVHDYWRDRYKVAADTLSLRPKIVSLNWHRLRAHVASFIDWLRIAYVNGWLGPARPKDEEDDKKNEKDGRTKKRRKLKEGVRTKMDAGVKAAKELLDRRSKDGLDLPYGPKAVALGLGEEPPPSERSGAPPGP
jgi:hypothetical protein